MRRPDGDIDDSVARLSLQRHRHHDGLWHVLDDGPVVGVDKNFLALQALVGASGAAIEVVGR